MARTNAPAPGIVGDVFRISVYTRTAGQVAINLFDYMGDTFAASAAANMSPLLTAFIAQVVPAFIASITADTNLFQYSVALISQNSAPTLFSTTTQNGQVAGHSIPLEMAAIITKRTNLKGQHGRGRIFMPAVPLSSTDPATNPNHLSNAGILLYNAVYNGALAVLTIGSIHYNLVVATRPIKPSILVTKAAIVTSCQVQIVLGTARRRNEGRGI